MAYRSNPAHHLFLQIKFYWKVVMSIHLFIDGLWLLFCQNHKADQGVTETT